MKKLCYQSVIPFKANNIGKLTSRKYIITNEELTKQSKGFIGDHTSTRYKINLQYINRDNFYLISQFCKYELYLN